MQIIWFVFLCQSIEVRFEIGSDRRISIFIDGEAGGSMFYKDVTKPFTYI